MSVALIPTAIGGVQAAASSAGIIQNILAGLLPNMAGLDAITQLAKDIGGFEFDYIGEERLEAGAEITKHFVENNTFIQDHRGVLPTTITMRGYVSEVTSKRSSIIPTLTALSTALAPVTPYLGTYSAGAQQAMANAMTQTEQILQTLAQVQGIYNSVTKLVGGLPGTQITKVRQAYNKLDALRLAGAAFAVVTPLATFGDLPDNGHGPMLIEHMTLVSPEDTRGLADIIVRMVEIRQAPSLQATTLDNPRGSQLPAVNGTVSANTA